MEPYLRLHILRTHLQHISEFQAGRQDVGRKRGRGDVVSRQPDSERVELVFGAGIRATSKP